MESDILQPVARAETAVQYVDDGEFVRLVLSRRKFERVATLGRSEQRIRDVGTGEVYEFDPDPDRRG